MRDEGELVLGFSGRIRAGKSTVTSAMAQVLGWPTASFGDFVRAEAAQRHLPGVRDALQAVGEELIATLGWPEFCERTLAHAGLTRTSVPCIVEGIRHVPALETLRAMFEPVPVYLIHLQTPEGGARTAAATRRSLQRAGRGMVRALNRARRARRAAGFGRPVRDCRGLSRHRVDEILAWLSPSSATASPDPPGPAR